MNGPTSATMGLASLPRVLMIRSPADPFERNVWASQYMGPGRQDGLMSLQEGPQPLSSAPRAVRAYRCRRRGSNAEDLPMVFYHGGKLGPSLRGLRKISNRSCHPPRPATTTTTIDDEEELYEGR